MDFKRDRGLLSEAIGAGIKTIGEFALFLRAKKAMLNLG